MKRREDQISLKHEAASQARVLSAVRGFMFSDIGRVRSENQDSAGVTETNQLRFYLVADGMGGARGGQQASRLAVDTLSRVLICAGEIDGELIRQTLKKINQQINEEALHNPSLKGMGTTLVGLVFCAAGLYVMNVGDSRAYRLRHGQLEKLTEDHTVVGELLRSGVLNEAQARSNPISNVLTKALGGGTAIEPDCHFYPDEPQAGDVFLLCSDGLYRHVDESEIASILCELPAQKAGDRLIALANERGGDDNITTLVVRVDDSLALAPQREKVRLPDHMPYHADTLQNVRSEERRFLPLHVPDQGLGSTAMPAISLATRVRHTFSARVLRQMLVLILAFALGTGVSGLLTFKKIPASDGIKAEAAKVPLSNQRALLADEFRAGLAPLPAGQIIVLTPAVAARSAKMTEDFYGPDLAGSKVTDLDTVRGRLAPSALEGAMLDSDLRNKSKGELTSELTRVRSLIDVETRKLTAWYNRQRQLTLVDPTTLADEIAVSASSVRMQKQLYDSVNWEYLREAETLLYNPADETQEQKVRSLARLRQERFRELSEVIHLTVKTSLEASLERLFELGTQRDQLQAALRGPSSKAASAGAKAKR